MKQQVGGFGNCPRVALTQGRGHGLTGFFGDLGGNFLAAFGKQAGDIGPDFERILRNGSPRRVFDICVRMERPSECLVEHHRVG